MIKEELKKETKELIATFDDIIETFRAQNKNVFDLRGYSDKYFKERDCADIKLEYNKIYTKSRRLISIILPERLQEFEECYRPKNIKKDWELSSYNISLGLDGFIKNSDEESFVLQTSALLNTQLAILESALGILDSKLFDIHGEIQYNLFTDELDTAQHLLKNKYLRPAGVVAGVVLESHLKSVCVNHSLKIGKRDSLSNYNENLKNNNVIDIPTWRKIQALTDIRNLCAHKLDREATKEEVQDLIIGVKSIISNLF